MFRWKIQIKGQNGHQQIASMDGDGGSSPLSFGGIQTILTNTLMLEMKKVKDLVVQVVNNIYVETELTD